MPLLIVMILIALGAQVIAGIYAIITPFANDLRQIQDYNVAYYGAIAGVERAYLVLRGHTAGFEGSGGWIGNNNYGPNSDYNSDIIKSKYFGLLSKESNGNGMFWQIKNLDTGGVVPEPGHGDLDPDISSGQNYYRLTFDNSLQYALYVDESPVNNYYTGYVLSDIKNLKFGNSLEASIRVPMKLADKFGALSNNKFLDKNLQSDNSAGIDLDGDGVKDDIIVNRSLFGYTGDTEFTIFPSININSNNTVATDDTAIREDVINGYSDSSKFNISYDTTSKDTNPNAVGNHKQNVDKFNQSPEDAVFTGFNMVLYNKVSDNAGDTSSEPVNRMNLKFSLVNLLKYDSDKIYPYLEVKLKGNSIVKEGNSYNYLPDIYFHILGEGKAGPYNVRIKLRKRVFNTSAASDFTVLF